jgi:hypothetical protein
MALAPLAPEAGLTFGLVILCLICLFLIALSKSWEYTIGALLASLATGVRAVEVSIPVIHKHLGLGPLADAIDKVNNAVLHAIGRGITWSEAGVHATLGTMAWLWQETARGLDGLAQDTAGALDIVRKATLPALIRAYTASLGAGIAAGKATVGALTLSVRAVAAQLDRIITPRLHGLEQRVDVLARAVAAAGSVVIAIPRAIPSAIPGDITSGVDGLWRHVKSITRTLTPAGILGLTAAAVLSGLGLGWTRCSNVSRIGKRACGLNVGAIEDLLGGLVVVFGAVSLVAIAEEMVTVTDALVTDVLGSFRETQGLKPRKFTGYTGKLG